MNAETTFGATWKEWLTATEMWYGAETWRERLWNATRWHLISCGGDDDWVPNRFRLAYTSFYMDCRVFALPPLHWILWWFNGPSPRWCIERAGIKAGLFQTDTEGGYYKNLIWRWPNGHRRCPADWPAWKQRKHHPRIWADSPPEE